MLRALRQRLSTTARRFARLFSSEEEREQLHYLLESAPPSAPLLERLQWFEALVAWVRVGTSLRHRFDATTGQLPNARLRFLLQRLDRNPEWRARVAATLRGLIRETHSRNLFTEVGVGHHRGFFAEASDRLMTRVLPSPPNETDLARLFARIFSDRHDAVWLRHVPAEVAAQLQGLIRYGDRAPETIYSGWRNDLRAALLILGSRVGTLGTVPEVLERLPSGLAVDELPFLRLGARLRTLAETPPGSPEYLEELSRCLEDNVACCRLVQIAYEKLEHSGVSVSLVYTFENLLETSRRIDRLLNLSEPSTRQDAAFLLDFLASLVEARVEQSSLRSLVRANLHLVASKVVERAGASGEHYITHTRSEYYLMVRAGLGGGAIMAFTTLFKFATKGFHPPLFAECVLFSINYAVSFVLLQLLGFTLATKQPSATASALAVKLSEFKEDGEVRGWVNLVCAMTRTQFAALLGNLLMLVPVALALDALSRTLFGGHILDEHTAHAVVASLHPLHSATLPMAMLTGVLLWISSLCAGWLENWVVFRRLPESLAAHRRLVRAFGERGARRIGDWTLHNASLVGGNVSLGVMMGVVSIAGPFLGLPIDVRHVTLSSASLTFALSTLGAHVSDLPAVIGCLAIGALNFAVGYSLAGAVAVRARNVRIGAVRRLFRALRVRFRHAPTSFFLPPAREATESPAAV